MNGENPYVAKWILAGMFAAICLLSPADMYSPEAVILFEPKPNTQNLFVTKIRWLK